MAINAPKESKSPAIEQSGPQLNFAADLADANLAPVNPCAPAAATVSPQSNAKAVLASAKDRPAASSCQQQLKLTFFFDGTGNNIDADIGTREHSNVARLYRAHIDNDSSAGMHAFYIPGLGTYFKDIGDPGGTLRGKAFGAMGQARLDWALQQFEKTVKDAEKRAQNPTNKILGIKVAVFGFSRGATAARAFCRDLQALCNGSGDSFRLKEGNYPVEVYFLGVFDTVASVGLPMSANNTPLSFSLGMQSLRSAMRTRTNSDTGAHQLAFGAPGADPAPGSHHGHNDWSRPLTVVSIVKKCVHMISGHEIRNSFPVDSALDGSAYPATVTEMVYPGVHSDVGGGYRPGESGRSRNEGGMLSLVPLRVMHQHASDAGVPLRPLSAMEREGDQKDFALDDEGAKHFAEMQTIFTHYMHAVGWTGGHIGQRINAHMGYYYAWRFHAIAQRLAAAASKQHTAEERNIRASDAQFRSDATALRKSVSEKKIALHKATTKAYRANAQLDSQQHMNSQSGTPINPVVEQSAQLADIEKMDAQDAYLKENARLDTLPGTADALIGSMTIYDQQLMDDAQAIKARMKEDPSLRLRPHYKVLVDAYDDEFGNHTGLRDEKIIAFFDTYVHDSLAGFANDATLPSDPRVVYIGGDVKLRYAKINRKVSTAEPELA